MSVKHPFQLRNAVVKRYDVVIVGAGIAGLAIAERLAREAKRQGKVIKILLVEQEDKLGRGASGGLEGWYHTGALYSKERRLQFFANFLSAFEDLYNWYYFDSLFPLREHCNLRDIVESRRPEYLFPSQVAGANSVSQRDRKAWFLGDLTYLLPRDPVPLDPDQNRFDREEWRRIRTQIQALVQQAFFQSEWVAQQLGCCQAPYVGKDIVVPDLNAPDGLGDEDFSNGVQPQIANGSMPEQLEAIVTRVAASEKRGEHPTTFMAMPSRDAALNSGQVLRDLTEAAIRQGVTILRGYKMDPQSVQLSPYGAMDRITGLLLRPTARGGETASGSSSSPADRLGDLHVIASQYIFSLGLGFDESELLHHRLNVHVKVQKKVSIMAVTTPALCDLSFARMDLYGKNDFNHIRREIWSSDGRVRASYSILADSNVLPLDAPSHQRVMVAEKLLEKAERYFGPDARRCLVGWYVCEKTEFPSPLEDAQRDYSYYFGPNLADWDEGMWETYRSKDRQGAQNRIRDFVMDNAPGIPENSGDPSLAPLVLRESNWALKKAIHFALQRLAWAARPGPGEHDLEAARETFFRLRNYAVREFERKAKQQVSRTPNFLCVIPGKFSLFSTLAHQVYSEIEVRGLFHGLPDGSTPSRPPMTDAELDDIVAVPHAEELVPQLEQWS